MGPEGWTYYSPRISLINTDKEAVQFFADVVGSNVCRRKMTDHNLRPLWYVEISAIDKLRWIIGHILPYVRVKKSQAECLFRFTSVPRPSGPDRQDLTLQREKLWQEFRQIAEDTGQAGSGRAIRYERSVKDWRGDRKPVVSVGNPEPSHRMKQADGRCDGQDIRRIGMKSTSARLERDDMTCPYGKP